MVKGMEEKWTLSYIISNNFSTKCIVSPSTFDFLELVFIVTS